MKYPIKCAYYIGHGKNIKDFFAGLIIKLCTGKYRHVELVFPHELMKSNSFSSSGWDGGVRFKKINYSNEKRWVFQTLGMFTEEKIQETIQYAKKFVGREYDYSVIPTFGFGIKRDDLFREWCSEICIHVINYCRLLPVRIKEDISPTKMYRKINKQKL